MLLLLAGYLLLHSCWKRGRWKWRAKTQKRNGSATSGGFQLKFARLEEESRRWRLWSLSCVSRGCFVFLNVIIQPLPPACCSCLGTWNLNLIISHQSQRRILLHSYPLCTNLSACGSYSSIYHLESPSWHLRISHFSDFFKILECCLDNIWGQWVLGNTIPRTSHIRLPHYRSIPIFNLTPAIKQLYSTAFIIYALFFLDLCITNLLPFNYSYFYNLLSFLKEGI